MDMLDILCPTPLYVNKGRFFRYGDVIPDPPTSGGKPFDYDQVDPKSKGYQMVFGTIDASDTAYTAIKTKKNLGFKVRDVVVLADGTAYAIESVAIDYGAKREKQSFRILATPAGVDFVLRIKEIENPWRL